MDGLACCPRFSTFFIVRIFSFLVKITIIIKRVACYLERIPIALNSSDLQERDFQAEVLIRAHRSIPWKALLSLPWKLINAVSMVTVLLLLMLKISSFRPLNKSKEMGWSL